MLFTLVEKSIRTFTRTDKEMKKYRLGEGHRTKDEDVYHYETADGKIVKFCSDPNEAFAWRMYAITNVSSKVSNKLIDEFLRLHFERTDINPMVKAEFDNMDFQYKTMTDEEKSAFCDCPTTTARRHELTELSNVALKEALKSLTI